MFQAYKQELHYAQHLGLPAVMTSLKGPKIVNLARCLNEHLLSGYFQQVNRDRNEPVHEISNHVVCATSKASDQPAHTHSLIRAFACRLNIL